MNPTSRLARQLTEVLTALQNTGVQSALIGGLALAPHKVIRATQDVDLLIDQDAADVVDKEIVRLGYQSSDLGHDEVREYFKLFNREELLDELLR